MRIAVAAPEFGRIWGGIGTYISQWLKGVSPRHDVTMLTGHKTASSDERIRIVPLTNGGGVMATYLRFQLALRRQWPDLVRDHRPDLLIVHHAQMPDLLTPYEACPVIVTTHTTILGQSRGIRQAVRHGGPLDGTERTTLAGLPALLPAELYYWKRVRHALFVSGAVRQEVEGTYAPELATSATIPNGFALDGMEPPEDGADLSSEEPGYLLFTGRLLGWKGLAVLLQALRQVRRPEKLFVTGSGDVSAWRRYAASLGLTKDRVEFLGAIPRPDLLARLRGAKLVLVPSFMESCPYSLIEAMMFQRPIVASSIPGIQDMVDDGVSAVLVPPGNAMALAAAIERLLEDESLRRRLGRAAADVARERFSVERMGDETLRYLERVLAAS